MGLGFVLSRLEARVGRRSAISTAAESTRTLLDLYKEN